MSPYDHPEWHAFVAAIRENPDEDTPRVVAADWLDERGEAARAELIRVQCEYARLDTSRLTPRHQKLAARIVALLGSSPGRVELASRVFATFERGFCERLSMPTWAWFDRGDEFSRREFVRHVSLTTWPLLHFTGFDGAGFACELSDRAGSDNFRSLETTWDGVPDDMPTDLRRTVTLELLTEEWRGITFSLPPGEYTDEEKTSGPMADGQGSWTANAPAW